MARTDDAEIVETALMLSRKVREVNEIASSLEALGATVDFRTNGTKIVLEVTRKIV